MPESLGKTLKRIRESRHLSIEEVSERSRIPKHIVSTLEEDRLNEIKSVFYAKSFVKTYAAFLGALDEPGIKEYLNKGSHELQKKPEYISKPVARPKEMPQVDFPGIIRYKNQIIAIIIGIFAFWVLSSAVSHVTKFIKNISVKKQNKMVKSVPTHQRSERKPLKEKKEEAIAVKTPYHKGTGQADGIEIEVSASDNTWLQIIGDGELMFTGAFRKGSKDTWKAKKEIKLEAGNSGVIKISINGKPTSFSGKKGEKKEFIITKDGIKN
ncbi:MAG: RodZ domain-containing protein [Candidatus Omnitrophota bacterium]